MKSAQADAERSQAVSWLQELEDEEAFEEGGYEDDELDMGE